MALPSSRSKPALVPTKITSRKKDALFVFHSNHRLIIVSCTACLQICNAVLCLGRDHTYVNNMCSTKS
uniref:Uncharacterized protein n=1 Tax=Oryza brachyantha TaxID=4533 RepID=J3MY53_ORYBR